MDFDFGPWAPDQSEVGGITVADGVLPHQVGYGPHPSLYTAPSAQALPSAARGVFSLVLNDGTWKAFALTVDSLYELSASFTWTLIDTGYACPVGYDWAGLHFGNKFLYTNTFDGLKSYDVEAGGAVVAISAAGKPAWIFTCANFVIALNCLDSLGNRNNKLIRTSGFNDQTNWTSDGADYQALADGESLVAGFDLKDNTALLLQNRALVLMQFGNIGGGAQFSLRKVADGKGTIGARSCVSFDGTVYFWDTDGPKMFSLATGLVNIGDQLVDQYLLGIIDQTQFTFIQGSVDPLNKTVKWRIRRSVDSSSTVSEIMVGYQWTLKRWFTLTEQATYLVRLATVGVTYDAASGTYDSQTLQYDDRFWAGNAPLSGALDENGKFAVFTGPSLAATITTNVINNSASGKVTWATPIDDALASTLELGTKDKLSDAIVYRAAVTKSASGRCDVEGRGLNINFTYRVPYGDLGASGTGWKFAKGIDHVVINQQGPK